MADTLRKRLAEIRPEIGQGEIEKLIQILYDERLPVVAGQIGHLMNQRDSRARGLRKLRQHVRSLKGTSPCE